jgi:hypothetical protein
MFPAQAASNRADTGKPASAHLVLYKRKRVGSGRHWTSAGRARARPILINPREAQNGGGTAERTRLFRDVFAAWRGRLVQAGPPYPARRQIHTTEAPPPKRWPLTSGNADDRATSGAVRP